MWGEPSAASAATWAAFRRCMLTVSSWDPTWRWNMWPDRWRTLQGPSQGGLKRSMMPVSSHKNTWGGQQLLWWFFWKLLCRGCVDNWGWSKPDIACSSWVKNDVSGSGVSSSWLGRTSWAPYTASAGERGKSSLGVARRWRSISWSWAAQGDEENLAHRAVLSRWWNHSSMLLDCGWYTVVITCSMLRSSHTIAQTEDEKRELGASVRRDEVWHATATDPMM